MKNNLLESEFESVQVPGGKNVLFQKIGEKTDKQIKVNNYTCKASSRPSNVKLNRYRDVSAYDHSRVILHRGDTDYINANLVTVERAGRKYILTQGPLENTVGHFWLMVWEQNSKAILMLNNIRENAQIKCHTYWPDRKVNGSLINMPDVGLTVEFLNNENYLNFSKRSFRLTDTKSNTSKEIVQFHYNTWPDFATPKLKDFLTFLWQIRASGALEENVGPPVVHCSAGIGRSGTFCLVDSALVIIERDGDIDISVSELLIEMRRYRMGLIQTPNQLSFSYEAIIEGIKNIKDSDFNGYEAVPVAETTSPKNDRFSYENEEHVETENNAPPPLPPPRVTSLLPSIPDIPLSPSIQAFQEFENRNNYVNNYEHRTAAARTENNFNNNIDRPLPAIPKDNSLERVNESDSDDYNNIDRNVVHNYDYFDSDDVENDDDNKNNNSDDSDDGDKIVDDDNANIDNDDLYNNEHYDDNEVNSGSKDVASNEKINNINTIGKSVFNTGFDKDAGQHIVENQCNGEDDNGNVLSDYTLENKVSISINQLHNGKIFDADLKLPASQKQINEFTLNDLSKDASRSDNEAVLRRRNERITRKAAIEQKVNDIKRKHKAKEEEIATASKKRRYQDNDVNK